VVILKEEEIMREIPFEIAMGGVLSKLPKQSRWKFFSKSKRGTSRRLILQKGKR